MQVQIESVYCIESNAESFIVNKTNYNRIALCVSMLVADLHQAQATNYRRIV